MTTKGGSGDAVPRTGSRPLTLSRGRRTSVDVVDAMAYLWRHYRSAAEPSGAVAFAGLLQATDRLPDGPVGVVLAGGNVDWPTYRRLLDDAMEPTERSIHVAPVLR
ncbi:hypothetical protein [Streptomyces phaeochromogenes]|uniref:hypothetical protein n=1 Tax=Streptomyces phaeochromogenes TaxID=1923 RepID=UPI003870E6CB|nr:hypothetical protein OHB08_51035 [Streptomyces phaeochromogenes]